MSEEIRSWCLLVGLSWSFFAFAIRDLGYPRRRYTIIAAVAISKRKDLSSKVRNLFWAWLLKYSSFWITGVISLTVGYVLHRITNRYADLIFYTSHVQWVTLPAQQGAQAVGPIGTFTLFLWNAGKAPAQQVHVGHYLLPGNNVFPDIPRETVQTPGGGQAIRFPTVPPRTLISISYLFFGILTVDQIISYVGWEGGTAKRIPVILQRVFPKWFNVAMVILLVGGLWVATNAIWSLIHFLWIVYYKP